MLVSFLWRIGTPSPRAEGIAVLASGSRGNASLVFSKTSGVLVDCGISARQVRARLEAADLTHIRIEAIILTHEHADHVAGVRVLAQRLGVPVLATRGTLMAARDVLQDVRDAGLLRCQDAMSVGEIAFMPFSSSHDAEEPVGLRFDLPSGRALGYISDTGILTGECLEALSGVDVLAIESNHDMDMLARGPYPEFLKARIRSATGHLSNADAARGLEALAHDGMRTVIALHLSEQNNTPHHALDALRCACDRIGLSADIVAASQHEPLVCSV